MATADTQLTAEYVLLTEYALHILPTPRILMLHQFLLAVKAATIPPAITMADMVTAIAITMGPMATAIIMADMVTAITMRPMATTVITMEPMIMAITRIMDGTLICFLSFQLTSVYRAGTVVPYGYSSYYGYPAAATTTTYIAASTPAAAATTTTATASSPKVQYAYVRAAATPTELPKEYRTVNYTSRVVRTAEDIQFENRRVATERGAYKARRIKPADAKADDVFWCRERNGDWNLRPYYQIEESCYPGVWQMDAEVGFLVFHRE